MTAQEFDSKVAQFFVEMSMNKEKDQGEHNTKVVLMMLTMIERDSQDKDIQGYCTELKVQIKRINKLTEDEFKIVTGSLEWLLE